MNGTIYCTTNLIDAHKYIGYTTTSNPRYLGSNKHLKNAVKKYGRENFVREILQDGITNLYDLREAEIYWIDYFGADISGLFYNITKGGEGNPEIYKHAPKVKSEEYKQRIGESVKGRKMPKKVSIAIRASDYKKRGKRRTEETRRKMSLAHKGKKLGPYSEKKREAHLQSWKTHGLKISKPVIQLDLENNFIKEWSSIKEAGEVLNISKGGISTSCKSNGKLLRGGFKWIHK